MVSLHFWPDGLDTQLALVAALPALSLIFALVTASALVITSKGLANVSSLSVPSFLTSSSPERGYLLIKASFYSPASHSRLETTSCLSFTNITDLSSTGQA